ncbi:hypothetical protein J2S00_003550 [Caldalkalibacillus uzonensis]|uniref:Uncharacterized protein n=2 Tax=Caldalkalibacillus uzonensis TaxID=353224 RepID=A0ABU0CWM3_9BACI|nr:hypothetical protein [Caldalkalibacillus uzonensis]
MAVMALGMLYVLLSALYLGVWVIFLWVVYHVLKTRLGQWSGLITVLIVLGLTWLLSKIQDSAVFAATFGRLVIETGLTIPLPVGADQWYVESLPPLALGQYLFHALLALCIFIGVCWLLDQQTEV